MRWLHAILLILLALPAAAEGPLRPGLAQVDLARSSIQAEGRDRGRPRPLELRLGLSRPVPYRVYFLDGPPRLVVDFQEVDFADQDSGAMPGRDLVPALRWGRFRRGWSRMVMELPGPYALRLALQTPARDGAQGALLSLRIEPVEQQGFVTRGTALSALWDLPEPVLEGDPALPRDAGDERLRVAIDPGHGGQDPGAQVGAISEAALMLGFAAELAEELSRAGFAVTVTRDDDRFIPLEQRMTIARTAGADLFISLHADALPAGGAAGLSLYTWNQQANDRATRELALRHDRDDLVSGLDLRGADSQVVDVLMDLARTETQPRSEAFAKFVVLELRRAGIGMHRDPMRGAAFSVLKSPDIPSVLIELGFLTDAGDRANLFDPDWRVGTAQAITRAIGGWAQDDAARAAVSRK
ncbi:N-acetylmuramoyl-L-alanine amidase [Paracoccus halophilus]|uniref:N-acetylmuramoyl-L-alanine amidase n=1 Tax=Paracoccus halophilus TaxID=376733 RepID=A0A099F4D6_9RHOB|nr:N-acetylmuramoyl-L-alanine amidase [Paracoccus halophilus]KGJ05056.1 N-acetylmuramoyl-L-alanine amidase [Paracoccus halophilus]SFA39992.1 N-acetylmuramoyl-L-alanine amidase [Paracoccus halophilus]